MSDEEDGEVVSLHQKPREDPILTLADVLTKALADAEPLPYAHVICAIRLATDAYATVLGEQVGRETFDQLVKDATLLRKRYKFSEAKAELAGRTRREVVQLEEERDAAKPSAQVIPFKRKERKT